MKKYIITFTLAAVAFTFQACHKVSGDGPAITRSYSQTGFKSINTGIDGDLYYTQDSVYKVEIHAQSNILDQIETKVVDGELQIEFEKFKNIGHHDRISIYVSSPDISGLGVNGSGTLYALQGVRSGSMNLKVNGSGNITITKYTGIALSADISGSGGINVNGGEVKTENLHISGSGNMDLQGLIADNVTTNTSGSGNMTVYASKTLNAHISGSGNVFYMGYPVVFLNISGSGSVSHQ
jgi:hypothetical protein